MFIRYNSTAKYYEYDTSAAQNGSGPWAILPLIGHPAGPLPANVAYKDVNNNFSAGQNFVDIAVSNSLSVSGIITGGAVRGGTIEARGNNGFLYSFDVGGPVDQRAWAFIQYNSGILYLTTYNDAGAGQSNHVAFLRNGVVQFINNYTEHRGGAYFPADSSNPGLLDRYEEGVWTPSFGADVVAPTGQAYSQQNGTYIRVGRLVHVNFNLSISTVGTGSGNLTIANLPFTVYGQTASSGSISYFAGLGVAIGGLYPLVINGFNFCHIYAKTGNSTGMDLPLNYSHLVPTSGIYGSANYLAP